MTAQVSDAFTGQAMPSSFIGVSIEYPALHVYTGRDPRHIDPVLINLLRALAPGQRPVLRIGGNSADQTWWPQRGTVTPGGIFYALSPDWTATAHNLARALDAKLILGINLAAGRPSLAGSEARALLHGIGIRYLDALEVGNEPDLYGAYAWYRNRRGRWVYARPHSWNMQSYIKDFSRWRANLPVVPLVGPSFAELSWLNQLNRFIAAEPTLSAITIHRYPLRGCDTPPSSPLYATTSSLLADSSSAGLAGSVAQYAAASHQAGLPFRLDELNSVACRGKWGVSNTFSSALWALDTLYNLAAVGVDGVNFHMLPRAAYELFSPSLERGRWQAFVRPEYYGLLMFARGFPPGAHLLQVSVPDGPVKVWATRGTDGHTRVMLINKDPRNAVTVNVQVQYATGPAELQRLTAPSVSATRGVRLAGQSFGAATATGRLAGRMQVQTIGDTGNGVYSVSLPAGSAALLVR